MVAAGLLASFTQSAIAQPFAVGALTAQPGELVSGMLDVPAASDPGTEIPVTIIHGTEPGPVVALVAGNHGYEYTPILALQDLRERIDPRTLRGTVILVHVANMPSFLERTIYRSPIDGKNLNRVYPGKKDGTVSERIAYALTTEVIEKADYLLDLHCGDGNESLRPYVYSTVTGNVEMDDAILQMALAFGIEHIVLDRERPGDPESSIYCSTTAITRGKPAVTVESGYLGTTDRESVERIEKGVLNVLKHYKLLDGRPDTVEHPVFFDPVEVLTSPVTGILYPHVKRGETVAQGALLVTVTDFFGKTLAEVRSPFAGEVLYVVATPPIRSGEPVGMIGAIKPGH